jgi:hypothetical protein
MAAPSQGTVVTIIADNSPLASSPHCRAAAPTLKAAHMTR